MENERATQAAGEMEHLCFPRQLFVQIVLALLLALIPLSYAISPPSQKYLPPLLQFQSHFLNKYCIYFFLLIPIRILAQISLILLGDTFSPPVLSKYCLTLFSHLANSLSGYKSYLKSLTQSL